MTDERATIRPVTLSRLVEVTHLCSPEPQSPDTVESELDVTHRRARETVLEATRIGFLTEYDPDSGSNDGEYPQSEDNELFEVTQTGTAFLTAIQTESWRTVSEHLAGGSPHYEAFLQVLSETYPASPSELLDALEETAQFEEYTFNQTGIEVVGDWAERLGRANRNAFSGAYYPVEDDSLPCNFPEVLLTVFDQLETNAGTNLRQRYLSIPELREYTCEELTCSRGTFDDGLLELVEQNVGKLELSGAPVDTGAKDARYGIKEIAYATEEEFVSTSQSTDAVMDGVEQFGKQYYYLAVHDRDLAHDAEEDP